MKHRERFSGRLHREQLAALLGMAALSDAGFTIPEIITGVIPSISHAGLKSRMTALADAVHAGRRFSEAMTENAVFPPVVMGLVRAGEETGTIAPALSDAAELLEARYQRRQEMTAALTYPLLIIFLTCLAVVFLAVMVIPRVADLYTAAGHAPPLATRMILWLGWAAVAGAVPLALTVFFLAMHSGTTGTIRRFLFDIIRRLPFPARLMDAYFTGIWSRVLRVLLRNGIPVPDAVHLTGDLMIGSPFEDPFRIVESRIREGYSISSAFAAAGGFSGMALRLIRAGDQAGALPGVLEKITAIHDVEYRAGSRKVIALAEPLAVLLAGLLVLMVAMGVMVPMAQLGSLL